MDLKPGGYHVMLMDLKKELKPGETVPVTLVVEGADKKRETIEVKAPVKPLAGKDTRTSSKCPLQRATRPMPRCGLSRAPTIGSRPSARA